MDIERQMSAVECNVIFEREPQLPAQRASNRLYSRPEQPVMHNQKIDVSLLSLGQHARRNINRPADARHPAGVFDLESVKGVVPITHMANTQKAGRVTDNL